MKSEKVLTVIQARTSSSRLPNKVLMPLGDKPLLIRMIERVSQAKYAGTIVVATSSNKEDDILEKLCNEAGINIFRGNLTDLLDRHYKAGLFYDADVVVKIPSDCPLIDPEIIDKVIKFYLDNSDKYDYVSNLHPATYPDGNDVEVMHISVLETAWKEAMKNYQREHTTPFLWEEPERFRLGNIEWETGSDFSTSYRLTIDYPEDYELIKKIFETLYNRNRFFSVTEIVQYLDLNPKVKAINEKYLGLYWYENHLDELKNIEDYKLSLQKNSKEDKNKNESE